MVAVWDADADRADREAARLGVEAHRSLDDLLARSDDHAVSVCGENAHHAHQAEELLQDRYEETVVGATSCRSLRPVRSRARPTKALLPAFRIVAHVQDVGEPARALDVPDLAVDGDVAGATAVVDDGGSNLLLGLDPLPWKSRRVCFPLGDGVSHRVSYVVRM